MDEIKEPITQSLDAEEAQTQFIRLLDDVACGRTRVVVEKDGVPVAALVSLPDLSDARIAAMKRVEFRAALGEMWEAFKDVDPATIEEEVAAAVAEARGELREKRRHADQS